MSDHILHRTQAVGFHLEAVTGKYPEPPAELSPEQAQHFNALIKCLHPGDVNEIVVLQLTEAAILWVHIAEATRNIDLEGPLRTGSKGQYPNPNFSVRRSLVASYNQACRLAGIDQIKRVQTLANRGAASELRRTEGSPDAHPDTVASDESLFADPVADTAPRPLRAASVSKDINFGAMYGRPDPSKKPS